ncbi:MAG: FAD-dependent oxidoreductase, partial [Bacilli bacterium]|nr:FAD-dependent oxidoreductase [Bacilli bacterium]
LEDYGIPLYLSHTVSKVIGKGRLEKIVLSKVDEKMQPIPGTEKEFDVDTLILSIGLLPNNDLLNHLGIPTSRSRGSLVNDKLETCVPGIFSCGNVLHVHDLVDNVVEEAREAGKNAAIYLKGEEKKATSEIEVIAGDGIGYVVPGKVAIDESLENITFKFRVRKPSKNVYIQYEQNGNVIKKVLKTAIIPSEMEIQKLPRKQLVDESSPITIKMVAKEM